MRKILACCIAGILVYVVLFPVLALAKFGIDPGKVYIDNLHPGAEADVPITIYNQNDYTTSFIIRVRQPNYTENGYEPLPYLDWVSVDMERVIINALENSEVIVRVIMPDDAIYSGKKAEVWISFKEEKPDSNEMIQLEIAARLLISTKAMQEDQAGLEPEEPSTVVEPTIEGGNVGITAQARETGENTNYVYWIVAGIIVIIVVPLSLLWARKRMQNH